MRRTALACFLLAVAFLVLSVMVQPLRFLWRVPAATTVVLLGLGFWWLLAEIESTDFTVREAALVATMGSLSAVARIPFAAVPGVQPATFLVFCSGYTLGKRNGFLVGVITALLSNFFLPNGPWTLWQMAGWGAIGASAGWLRSWHGAMSREGIAIFLFFSAFVFDALVQVNTWLTHYAPTPQSFLFVLSLGLPFSLAHGIGNVFFALTLSHRVIPMLERVRDRSRVYWAEDNSSPDAHSPSGPEHVSGNV